MILFGIRDVGAVNACLPVISILKERGVPVSVYAEDPASGRLKGKLEIITEGDITVLLDSVRPSLVVVSPSTAGGTIPVDLTDEAKKRNLRVVLVEDLWSGHSSSRWNFLPDSVCVADEFAKELILRSWSNYPKSNIHVTGSPVFDKFVNMQVQFFKRRLREILELDKDWPVIYFAGEVWGMVQAVPMFIEALNGLDIQVYLILRDHPKVTSVNAPDEFRRIYLEYHKALIKLEVGKIVDSKELTSDEVNAGADIVVGISSTMLVEACYMHKPVLHIWTPEIGEVFSK